MGKLEIGLAIVLYGPVAIYAIGRMRVFCQSLDYIEDMKGTCVRHFLFLIIEGLICYGLHTMAQQAEIFPLFVGAISSYILLYGVAYHLLCWIVTLVCLSRDAEEKVNTADNEPRVKGIGTDPNSPNLSAADFQRDDEDKFTWSYKEETKKSKKERYKPEKW